jgi:quinol monooxygenase YgiN
MHIRINDVTVSPARIDELGDVLSNKALPVVTNQKGCEGLLCAADRSSGNAFIVSFWDSQASLVASEKAIAAIRSETVDAVDATLNSIVIAEVLRELRVRPTQVGSRVRVVRFAAPAGKADKMLEFFETVAIPRLEGQLGLLSARLIRDVERDGSFSAVSHWADTAALESSEKNSVALREELAEAIPGASVEGVSTPEIILVELRT